MLKKKYAEVKRLADNRTLRKTTHPPADKTHYDDDVDDDDDDDDDNEDDGDEEDDGDDDYEDANVLAC